MVVAKSHLTVAELDYLGRIGNAYLKLAGIRAKRRAPMTMEGWAERLDVFLSGDDLIVVQDSGSVSAEIPKEQAETEFENCRLT